MMPTSSSAPLSPSLPGPRPLQLVDGNLQSPVVSSCPSPTLPGMSTPPLSAHKFHPRRQSSISYYPSDHTPSWDVRSLTTTGPTSLKRSSSLNQKVPSRLLIKGDRRSLPPSDETVDSPIAERTPLTLTEKHADLLRFIAQKESKCLELRSQLAAHEAELAQLKRKWERVVKRGMDRAYSQQSASTGSGSLLTGAVKDVSRLLAAGLSDIAASPTPTPPYATKHDMAALRTRKADRMHRHATTQSTSSVSTTATSATSASLTSSSVRLSQSSASSLAFDDPPYEQDEGDSDGGSGDNSLRRTSLTVDGGTGIESPIEISPSSASKTAKLHRRKSREAPLPLSPLASSSFAVAEKGRHPAKEAAEAKERITKRSSSQLPPAASIPGLGPLASPLASAWMDSVGNSVGKKWEELQKTKTFAKSQKRASLLFSDAASSLFAALAAPSSSSPSSSSSRTTSSVSVSSNPFAATLSPLASSPSPSSVSASFPGSSAQSLLEEDDDDGASALGNVMLPDSKTLTPLYPMLSASATAKPRTAQNKSKSLLNDDGDGDDDWNW